MVLAAFAGGALVAGATVAASKDAAKPKKIVSPYPKLNVFTKVLTRVENDYVEEVDQEKLIYGAIAGMLLATLDPHSAFFSPEEYKRHPLRDERQLPRRRHGDSRPTTTPSSSSLPSTASPAAKAGIRAGDRVIKIDGTSPPRG